MRLFSRFSLKNKIFVFSLAIILPLSLSIALIARWILVSTLISELINRGVGIAHSVAENSRRYVMDENYSELNAMIYHASRFGTRKNFITSICILDRDEKVLARYFIDAFPEALLREHRVRVEQDHSTRLLRADGQSVYDIAVPVKFGSHQIGTVHLGLNKKAIDNLVIKLRNTFFGFLLAIVFIFLGISQWMSRHISRPMSQIARMADAIGRGNLNVEPARNADDSCLDIINCGRLECPARLNTETPCWYIDGTLGELAPDGKYPEKLEACRDCLVYKKRSKDEISQLTDSFINMIRRIKDSHNKLRESDEKYRSLVNSGPNPIFVVDSETLEILEANPRAEDIYGYVKEDLIGRRFTELGPLQLNPVRSPEIGSDDGSDPCFVYSKVRHLKKGNQPFYVNAQACPIRYGDREAIIVATWDITEIMEKDAQLIQAGKMATLGEMSAGIAHELNQPLNAIKMGSEFLKLMIEKGKAIPNQDLNQVTHDISDQVDRASDIINRLREFGRKADFAKEKIDINRAVHDVLDLIGNQISLHNITVDIDLNDTLPPISAQKNRLDQVFFNLVSNACDAINKKQVSGPGSGNRVIGIRSFMEGGRVAVTVSDTGVGIPVSQRNKIFEPFFTTKDTGERMGLGLSIVYGIIKEFDGTIHVESEEGEGTTFRLSFPAALEKE